MSTNMYSCLINTSRMDNVGISKKDEESLHVVFEAALAALSQKLSHSEDDYGYADEEDTEQCISEAVCGADEPDRIINIANHWKDCNDQVIATSLDKLADFSKTNDVSMMDSLKNMYSTNPATLYEFNDALNRYCGYFTYNDDQCVIDEYGCVRSGCDSDGHEALVKEVHDHPEYWVMIDVPYYD